MKTKPLSIRENTKPVILYMDDVVYLVQLLNETAEEIELKFRGEDKVYEINTIGELEKLNEINVEKFNNLELNSHNPYMSVELRENGGSIYISEDTPVQRGLLEKIKKRLNLRKRKYFWLLSNAWLPLLPFWYGIWQLAKSNYVMSLAIIILSGVWYLLGFWLHFNEQTTVFTKSINEMPTFFMRKKDEIILMFASAIVGAAITFLVMNFA